MIFSGVIDAQMPRFCCVVAITSALHAECREFEARQNLFFLLPELFVFKFKYLRRCFIRMSRDRLVVRTLRCGRNNPGSNPGHGRLIFHFKRHFAIDRRS